MNFLIHYIYEIASRENIYAGRLRFSGSLCLRVQRNAMSIDLCSPVRFSRSHTANSKHTPQYDSLCFCYTSSAPTDITVVSPTRPLSPVEINREISAQSHPLNGEHIPLKDNYVPVSSSVQLTWPCLSHKTAQPCRDKPLSQTTWVRSSQNDAPKILWTLHRLQAGPSN